MRDRLTWLYKKDEYHRTRLHDAHGNFVPLSQLLYVPPAVVTTVLKRVGYHPPIPWFPFNATRAIARLLQPTWRVVEFGSGMSTVWLARRVASVHSVEHDRHWHELVSARMPGNVELTLAEENPAAVLEAHDDLDFVIVDGMDRNGCMRAAIPKVRPGGWIYLDNTDNELFAEARELLVAHATHVRRFTGMTPYVSVAGQGMLCRL